MNLEEMKMTPQELQELKTRSVEKHKEIQAKIQEIESKYILENCPHKIGDEVIIGTKVVKNKVTNIVAYVNEITIDYQVSVLPVFRVVLYSDKKDGKYVKTLYI